MRSIAMPSGATLHVAPAPFADAKRLYQAVLAELKHVPVRLGAELPNLLKDVFCSAFSSPDIEAALKPCLARCTYNKLKVEDATFEPIEARQDYMKVCVEVARENIDPFAKSLYAEFKEAMAMTSAVAPQ